MVCYNGEIIDKFVIFIIYLAYLSEEFTNAQSFDNSNKASIFKEKFMKASKSCSSTYNVSLAEIITLIGGNNETGNKQGMCFLACMLQRYEVMGKSGVYHTDKLNKFLDTIPDSRFKSSLKSSKDKCLKEDADNLCQKAYKFSKCLYRSGIAKSKKN